MLAIIASGAEHPLTQIRTSGSDDLCLKRLLNLVVEPSPQISENGEFDAATNLAVEDSPQSNGSNSLGGLK